MAAMASQSGRFDNNTTNNNNSSGNSIARTSSSVSSRSDSSDTLARSSSFAVSGSQSLASILNNPHVGKAGVYGSDASWLSGWWSSSSAGPTELPPLTIKQTIPDVQRSDFETYLSVISETYGRFEDIRLHSSREESGNGELVEASSSSSSNQVVGQGEALVACLREVPSLYFKEDFALEEGPTFRAACPFSSAAENAVLQEKLSQYLDTVEMHLVKEISLRSNSFFEAQGQLQGLNFQIVEACGRIRELKETIRLLQADVVDSARKIQDLNGTRSSLIALQQKLTLILYVSQALSALKLLVGAADCAGALDVTDDLRHLLDSKQLFGLHCFLHLREHLATSVDSVNSILSSDFMRASILEADNVELIILRLKAKVTNLTNVRESEVGADVGETAVFVDRLFPIIIGLLRTAKLPYVLRIYREKLIDDMKAAIKTMVSELLPILVARPAESDLALGEQTADTDGAGSSMATKMRNLPSESFLRLLDVVFEIVQAYLVRASKVKQAIEQIMHNLDGTYAADSVATALALGAAAVETGQENEKTSPSNVERNFRADILRENTEALLAACDAAQGRWAKLLGVRALLHPKLRLPEFLSIHNISQDFITATEKIGGRHAYSIRGTLQSQMKAFIDFQHESRMEKLKALLDQETWVAVDVPYEFQAIVNSLVSSENGNLVDASSNGAASYSEVVSENGDLAVVDTQVSPQQPTGNANSSDNSVNSTSLSKGTQESKAEAPTSSARTLVYKGNSYHMVNCCLILLKMLSEYVAMNKFLPALASEVVHRVVEILKYFNQRTVFLVLGAGAMQVSGMRAITAKHLALSSQVISFVHDIIPELRHVLLSRVPESRKALLLSEISRVAQDYKGHRDEIHTKLVQIMTERLVVHLRSLPQIVESWNRPEDNDLQPSQFARALVKEVGILQRVLSRTLHEVDVKAIFRQVAQIFHSQISEKFRELEINTAQAKNRLYQDLQHLLGCIHSLPTDYVGEDGVPNKGKLDEFLLQRYETEASK